MSLFVPELKERFSIEEFCDLKKVINSRKFEFTVNNQKVFATIPLADMFNTATSDKINV